VIRDYRQETRLTSGLNHHMAELSHPWRRGAFLSQIAKEEQIAIAFPPR